MGLEAGTALLAKISDIMSNPEAGQFTSFLTLAEGWDMNEIGFDGASDLNARDNANWRGAFARRVNQIPIPGDAWSSSGTYVWDVYRDVVEGSVLLADASRSDEEEALIQHARELLGTPGTPSASYQAYLTYRDQNLILAQKKSEAELTFAHSTDPLERDQADADRKRYADLLRENEEQWIVNGYRDDIDQALQTLVQAYADNPARKWKMFKDGFSLVVSENDANGSFWPTQYRPLHPAKSDDGWIMFTLSGNEIQSLAASAPPAIVNSQSALGDAVRAQGEIQSLSMEVMRVNVERTWFNPELLNSRFWSWKQPDSPPLSDGARPHPAGRLPGYIIGLVLVRNISVVWQSVAHTDADPSSFRILGNFALSAKALNNLSAQVRVLPLRGELFSKATTVVQEPIRPANFSNIAQPLKLRTESLEKTIRQDTPLSKLIRQEPPLANRGIDLYRKHAPQEESPHLETQSTGDAVYLIGYIVQQSPKSPNPDPALTWPSLPV